MSQSPLLDGLAWAPLKQLISMTNQYRSMIENLPGTVLLSRRGVCAAFHPPGDSIVAYDKDALLICRLHVRMSDSKVVARIDIFSSE